MLLQSMELPGHVQSALRFIVVVLNARLASTASWRRELMGLAWMSGCGSRRRLPPVHSPSLSPCWPRVILPRYSISLPPLRLHFLIPQL